MSETTTPRPAGKAGERLLVLDGDTYRAQLDSDGVEQVWDICWKCSGTGYLCWTTLDESRCWACHTTKGKWVPVARIERRIKDRARRAAKRNKAQEAKSAKVAAELQQFEADHPELAFMTGEAVHDPEIVMNHIVRDIARRLQIHGSISEKQRDLCARIVREDDERRVQRQAEREAARPAPVGRLVVEGKVIKAVERVSGFGYHSDYTTRITVLTDEGWIANGNCPRGVLDAASALRVDDQEIEDTIKGLRVRFTATVEPKDDDPTFAFFKRAAKGEIVAEAS